ncbi:MAG TPA: DUF4097 family beta strand repeat-containing protein [Chloroflexota bacterium]|nr:DUF4097 family beta strand repeat-containing protein [Chloroflexota bacterium]
MTTEVDGTVRQEFEVGPNSELSVSNVSGRIHVQGKPGNTIRVKAMRSSSSRREPANVDIRREGNKVSVQTKASQFGLMNFGRVSPVQYDIEVPIDCAMQLNAVSADILVSGTRAGLSLQTVSGDLRMDDIAGDITMTTVSGDIVANALSGTVVARTTSGDCIIRSSRLRRFSINTVSGDFDIESPLFEGEQCFAKSVSGDLCMLVPPDTAATVQLKSVSGSVECRLPAEIIRSGRRHWQGRINGGGASLEMNSVSGDLAINPSGSARSPSPEPVASVAHVAPVQPSKESRVPMPEEWGPSATPGGNEEPGPRDSAESPRAEAAAVSKEPDMPPDTTDILQALERGEISVDEAMTKLGEVG